MIKKLVVLKNVGKFNNSVFGGKNWNGVFEDINIFYAQNGSGKTTLSLLFQSLSGNDELLKKKKSFGSEESIEVKFISEKKKEIKYLNGKWNNHISKIKVFNNHFVEKNVYVINIREIDTMSSNMEFMFGEDNINLSKEITEIKKQRKELENEQKLLKQKIKDELGLSEKKLMIKELKEKKDLNKKLGEQYRMHRKGMAKTSPEFNRKFIEKVNSFLSIFNPDLQLTKFHQKFQYMIYGLKILNYNIRANSKTEYSLRYTLSEGDKNALAFSFFLADLDLTPRLDEHMVVIDDPITSFDYSRKNTTINLINNLKNKVKKLIILTHDLNFANDLTRRLNHNCLNLKIVFTGVSSVIINHDIKAESLTGIFKDLKSLNQFIEIGANTDTDLREVVRCIRPVLEGILRIKYYGLVSSNEWLGDIIGKINDSKQKDPFHYSKKYLNELIELNDYSKQYHHSNPYYFDAPINPNELRIYVTRLIDLLRKI